MLKVGVTGGIGSGKTIVCMIFETMGLPVYYADKGAKLLLNEDADVITAVRNTFGEDIYEPNGQLDRHKLAGIVFTDHEKLRRLEAIVHPAVQTDFEKWANNISNVHYVIKEAALLYESGSYKKLDKVIVVTAPEELRVRRVMERDKVGREKVMARLNKQMPESEKAAMADYLVVNDEEHLLIPQVMKIHHELLRINKLQ